MFERYGSKEFYALVAVVEPQPAVPMTDMFAGLAN